MLEKTRKNDDSQGSLLEEEQDKANESDRFVLEEANFREEKEQTHATVAKAVGDKVSAAVKKARWWSAMVQTTASKTKGASSKRRGVVYRAEKEG